MFALGLLSWMYSRPTEGDAGLHRARKFANKPDIATANTTAFKAGYHFGETTEAFAVSYEIKPAALPQRACTATSPATWRWPTG